MIGPAVTLTYPVAVPRAVSEVTTGLPVDLTERLNYLAGRCLPCMNQRLGELHREDTLEAAPGWSRRGTHRRWVMETR